MSNRLLYHKILPRGEFRVFSQKPDFALVRAKQIHSTGIAVYDGAPLDEREVDGVAFAFSDLSEGGVGVAVITADCMPIIFLSKDRGVFLHAGWRGLAGGILSNPLAQKINPHYAFIGPSIGLESYEVKNDFKQRFPQEEFYHEIDGKTCFDLQGKAVHDICLAYPGIQVELADEDTFSLRKYHSWRRDKTAERNWNIFSL